MIPTSGLEDPTAIKNVKSAQDSKMNSSKIYDLSGKRANADTKGIIIEKGVKKVK
jgi:predicted Mrr-cat superfamily restriction endonuclease